MTIPVIPLPDEEVVERLHRFVGDARREMGEARWRELNAEWEPEEKPAPRTLKEHIAEARERLGEERWKQLNDEWEQPQ